MTRPYIIEFGGLLSLGGTEKAMVEWSKSLTNRGYPVTVAAMRRGPRADSILSALIPILSIGETCEDIESIPSFQGRVVLHMHSPGTKFVGDRFTRSLKAVFGDNLSVVSTNIFGRLQNPDEIADFRLFISWTSCIQAARRSGRKLDREFFRRQSVASYPLGAPSRQLFETTAIQGHSLRERLGLERQDVLFGRFSRPEPNKWTPVVLDAFLEARKSLPHIRLLLQEPPPEVTATLVRKGLATLAEIENSADEKVVSPIIILRATRDPSQLTINQAACDVVLHTSSIGESFGYGLAEPMALGKPVIANSVPWYDQAQIELVRHGECGLIASTAPAMRTAIVSFANDAGWREACGSRAAQHIVQLADPERSTDRVQVAIDCAMSGSDNPHMEADLEMARKTAEYLDRHQWGSSLKESLWLRGADARFRFLHWQRKMRDRFAESRTP